MDHSKSYLALDQMIEKGWLVPGVSDFDQMLSKLEQSGHITRDERQSLLLRFIGKKVKHPNPGEEPPGQLLSDVDPTF